MNGWTKDGKSSEGWSVEVAEVSGCTWAAAVQVGEMHYKGIGHTKLAAKRDALRNARADRVTKPVTP